MTTTTLSANNINLENVLEIFNTLEGNEVYIDHEKGVLSVGFNLSDDYDLAMYFTCYKEENVGTITYENMQYVSAELLSCGELPDVKLDVDFSGMIVDIQEFMQTDKYQTECEIYFSSDEYSSAVYESYVARNMY